MYLSPNTALEILDNAEELELICIQLEEEKENTVPQKRQRKKSRLAMESDGMDFIGLTPCNPCLLYTSPSPRDLSTSRMPSSA